MTNEEIAIHLWSGYCVATEDDSLSCVEYVARFVPYVAEISELLDAQLLAGRDDWNKVFAYDVVQEAGAWLWLHVGCTDDEFKTELARLIA
jgi:hypothetical protein